MARVPRSQVSGLQSGAATVRLQHFHVNARIHHADHVLQERAAHLLGKVDQRLALLLRGLLVKRSHRLGRIRLAVRIA